MPRRYRRDRRAALRTRRTPADGPAAEGRRRYRPGAPTRGDLAARACPHPPARDRWIRPVTAGLPGRPSTPGPSGGGRRGHGSLRSPRLPVAPTPRRRPYARALADGRNARAGRHTFRSARPRRRAARQVQPRARASVRDRASAGSSGSSGAVAGTAARARPRRKRLASGYGTGCMGRRPSTRPTPTP